MVVAYGVTFAKRIICVHKGYRQIEVNTRKCTDFVALPVQEATKDIAVWKRKTRATGSHTRAGSQLPYVVRENEHFAMAIRVHVYRRCVRFITPHQLPHLIGDVVSDVIAESLVKRCDFTSQGLCRCAISFPDRKLHSIVPIAEVIHDLQQNTRRNLLCNRGEAESNTIPFRIILTVTQAEIEITGKQPWTLEQVLGQLFSIHRPFHQLFQFTIVSFDIGAGTNQAKRLSCFRI